MFLKYHLSLRSKVSTVPHRRRYCSVAENALEKHLREATEDESKRYNFPSALMRSNIWILEERNQTIIESTPKIHIFQNADYQLCLPVFTSTPKIEEYLKALSSFQVSPPQPKLESFSKALSIALNTIQQIPALWVNPGSQPSVLYDKDEVKSIFFVSAPTTLHEDKQARFYKPENLKPFPQLEQELKEVGNTNPCIQCLGYGVAIMSIYSEDEVVFQLSIIFDKDSTEEQKEKARQMVVLTTQQVMSYSPYHQQGTTVTTLLAEPKSVDEMSLARIVFNRQS